MLELTKDASQDDIKKAYMRLAKIHHPDKNGGDSEKVYYPIYTVQNNWRSLRNS